MSEPNQLSRDQMTEIVKNIVVSVDVNENAVVISAKRLLAYFLKNVEGLEKILKVDVDKDNSIVVYASVKPTNPNLKSIILKVAVKESAFNLSQFKHEIIKAGDDVNIKIYVQQNESRTLAKNSSEEEVDF
ncbi:SIFV.gp50-like protein [Sulfolobus islandicus filamentous virus 2]|uniref:SIFV.gp50-like protein n=1 Tax=Sulfolobus islandicus filamentous virus 2 TaxID=1902331 RepID=A0A1D8BJB4_SIFV|nr:SIFV.gp50-like protein [Sulfolobus islandicus filamentous virus 2]